MIRVVSGRVVWEMTPHDARSLAEFIDFCCSPTDGARADAAELERVAASIDGKPLQLSSEESEGK